ncbi:MAG: Rv0909 family putative TA system antitoxin [Leucobacter sp.]
MANEELGKQTADTAAKAKDFVTENAAKAKDFVEENADKVKEALQSDKAEEVSDKVLGGLADLANKLTGGQHADKVEEIKQKLDDSFGNEK